jgi:hypothetical protein
MRVQVPNKDDWNKLVHLMKYLRGTCMLPLILSANGTDILKWWVDAAFAVHPNMQGHSGGGLSLERISHCEFDQAEAQYLKLYGIGNCGS